MTRSSGSTTNSDMWTYPLSQRIRKENSYANKNKCSKVTPVAVLFQRYLAYTIYMQSNLLGFPKYQEVQHKDLLRWWWFLQKGLPNSYISIVRSRGWIPFQEASNLSGEKCILYILLLEIPFGMKTKILYLNALSWDILPGGQTKYPCLYVFDNMV